MRGPPEGLCSFHQFPQVFLQARRIEAGTIVQDDEATRDQSGTPAPHRRCAASGSAADSAALGCIAHQPAEARAAGRQRAEPEHVDAVGIAALHLPDPMQADRAPRAGDACSLGRHHDDAPDDSARAATDTAGRRRAAASAPLRSLGGCSSSPWFRPCSGVQPVKRRKAAMPNELEEHRRDQQQGQAGTRLRAWIGQVRHGRGRRKAEVRG